MTYFYSIEPAILRNPLRRGIRHRISAERSVLHPNDAPCTMSEFLESCRQQPPENIEIWDVAEADLTALLHEFGASMIDLHLYLKAGSLAALACLTSLKKLSLVHMGERVALWEMAQNTALEVAELRFPNCTRLENAAGLTGAAMRQLKLYADGISCPKPVPAPLFDVALLATLPQLKKAEIYMAPPQDPVASLKALASLSHLEELHLFENSFTFAQFAWLFTKLPHTHGFGGVVNFYPDRARDTHMMVISGSDRPDLPIAEEEAVHAAFRAACKLYEGTPEPPQ